MLQECDNFTRSLSLFVNYGFSLPHLGRFHSRLIGQPIKSRYCTLGEPIQSLKSFKRSRMARFKFRKRYGWKIPKSWNKYTLYYRKQNKQINNSNSEQFRKIHFGSKIMLHKSCRKIIYIIIVTLSYRSFIEIKIFKIHWA